jgi:hypothetical protein
MVGSSGTMVRAGLTVRRAGHVVVSLPSLEALIPLVDQPRRNAQAKVSKQRKVPNQYLGNPRRKVQRNEKEIVF